MAGTKKSAETATETAGQANEEKVSESTAAGAGTENTDAAQQETVKLIYIGPTLPRATLKTNRIFEGGTVEEIKKELSEVIEQYPLVERMLVPVKDLAEKKNKVRTAGNVLNKYYSDLVSLAAAAAEKEE